MEINAQLVMPLIITFGSLLLFGRTIFKPIKIIIKFIFKMLIGLIIIIVINQFASKYGILIPLNLINGAIIATLGIPGIILTIVISLM